MRLLAFLLTVVGATGLLMAQQRPGDKPPIRPNLQDGKRQLHPLILKMFQAQGSLTYSGTRVVELGVGAARKRHQEIVLRNGPRTRVEFPEDSEFAGQVIIENRGERRHYFPDINEIRVEPARFDEAFSRLGQLLKSGMQVSVEPGADIAGLHTMVSTFRDRQGNIIQRLWVDPSTGMILRRDLMDEVGNRTGYFEFSKVNYRPVVSPSDFELKRKGAKVSTLDQELQKLSRQLQLPPLRIPPSEPYALQAVRMVGTGDRAILAQVYTGQRGRVSLFQTRGPINPERMQRLVGGRLRSVTWQADGRSLAIMGDVTQDELVRLARLLGR